MGGIASPYLLNNPLLHKMVQDQQQQAASATTPGPVPQDPSIAQPQTIGRVEHTHDIAGLGDPDQDVKNFYRTHPGRHPLDEKPGGLSPQPIASQKSLAKVDPIQPNPTELAHQAEYNRLTGVGLDPNQGKPGWEQIKNPVGRTLAGIGNAVGGLFPRIAINVPGTTLHHQMLVGNERGALEQEQTNRKDTAKEQQEAALATEELNKGSGTKEPTNDFELWHQQNPNASVADWLKLTQKGAPGPKNEFEKWMADHPDGKLEDWEQFKSDHQKAVSVATPFEKWMKDNPNATVQDWLKLQSENKPERADAETQFVDEYRKTHPAASIAEAQRAFAKNKQLPPQTDRGQNFVDPTTHKLIRVEPNGTVPEGAITAGGLNSENVKTTEQEQAATKARQDAAKEYKLAESLVANPSPTNDVALIMRYIGATKPDSLGKLRLNNNEINLVTGTRSTLGDLEALAQKVQNGQKLTPQQRKDMLGTMRLLAGDAVGPEAAGGGNIPRIKDANDYNALKPGPYIDPNGVQRVKR